MSGPHPPEGDSWADVVAQVRAALREADVTDTHTEDALVDGLRQALSALSSPGQPAVPTPPPGQVPGVRVVEGGRDPDAEPSPGPGPELHVAPAPPVEAPGTEGAGDLRPSTRTSVRVVRPGRGRRAGLLAEGHFVLSGQPGEVHTLFRGAAPRAYRLCCDQGSLGIILDGSPVGDLLTGCTTDVEARLVQVRNAAAAEALGRYARLP